MSATTSSIQNGQGRDESTPALNEKAIALKLRDRRNDQLIDELEEAFPEIPPRTATPPAARTSSVDSLPASPGYEPITMANLWQIASAASDVVMAAYRHVSGDDRAFDLLMKVNRDLIAVAFYTCSLREADPCAQ
jgi:hypothetical protein